MTYEEMAMALLGLAESLHLDPDPADLPTLERIKGLTTQLWFAAIAMPPEVEAELLRRERAGEL